MSERKHHYATRKLNNEFANAYGSLDADYIDKIAFYGDYYNNEYYQWKFETPDKITHVWKYFFDNKKTIKECY